MRLRIGIVLCQSERDYVPNTKTALSFSFRSVSFVALVSYLEEIVGVPMPPNQRWYCILQVFFNYFAFLCSAYILIAMTFERFYSIVRPLEAASFNTVKRARTIIISILVLWFSYCAPFFYISSNDGKICIVNRFALTM